MTMEEQLNRIAAKITLCIELTDRERALWLIYGPEANAQSV